MDNPSLILLFSTHGARFTTRKPLKCFKAGLQGKRKIKNKLSFTFCVLSFRGQFLLVLDHALYLINKNDNNYINVMRQKAKKNQT